MGHLLFLLGSVSQKLMHKYEKESKKIGKQSFMYAWVLGRLKPTRTPICHDSLRGGWV
jgi:translation elongation factor EF-1alpha